MNKKSKIFLSVLGLAGACALSVTLAPSPEYAGYATDDESSIIAYYNGTHSIIQTVESNCVVVQSTRVIVDGETLGSPTRTATISDSEDCINVRFEENNE